MVYRVISLTDATACDNRFFFEKLLIQIGIANLPSQNLSYKSYKNVVDQEIPQNRSVWNLQSDTVSEYSASCNQERYKTSFFSYCIGELDF